MPAPLCKLPPDRLEPALRLVTYMLGEAREASDADNVLTRVAVMIRDAGVPLHRASSIVPLLHAEAVASARFWEHGKGARSHLFPFQIGSSSGYAQSPAAEVHKTGKWVALWLPKTPDDRYGIVPELKADGYVHYLMAPIFMRSGMAGTFSFATRRAAGFSAADIAFLRAVFPALSACQEILATARAMQEVLRIYVGEEPQQRILSGDVHRGQVTHIRSAVLFSDMRRFTELTAEMTAEEATGLLNIYYDCVVPPIETAGGEVLKFVGDGILAVFRTEDGDAFTCGQALAAARAALARVEARRDAPRFKVGIALHFGEVGFGNVGSGMRLDYTVVGRDVNLASRLAGLCSALGEPLLVSEEFCRRAAPLGRLISRSLGRQRLKGLRAPQEVFAVAQSGLA